MEKWENAGIVQEQDRHKYYDSSAYFGQTFLSAAFQIFPRILMTGCGGLGIAYWRVFADFLLFDIDCNFFHV